MKGKNTMEEKKEFNKLSYEGKKQLLESAGIPQDVLVRIIGGNRSFTEGIVCPYCNSEDVFYERYNRESGYCEFFCFSCQREFDI